MESVAEGGDAGGWSSVTLSAGVGVIHTQTRLSGPGLSWWCGSHLGFVVSKEQTKAFFPRMSVRYLSKAVSWFSSIRNISSAKFASLSITYSTDFRYERFGLVPLSLCAGCPVPYQGWGCGAHLRAGFLRFSLYLLINS